MGLAHNKLYRNFIILQEDEKGNAASNDKALSGYAKVESKGDKCKVSFYAQNLKQEANYSMVLICCKKDSKQLINLGDLTINEVGKGDTSKEYYINNIAGLGISYEKIVGAAICRINSGEYVFLMYGFMNGEEPKENWKKFKIVKEEDKNKDNKYKIETETVKSEPLKEPVKDKMEVKNETKDKEKTKSNKELKVDMETECEDEKNKEHKTEYKKEEKAEIKKEEKAEIKKEEKTKSNKDLKIDMETECECDENEKHKTEDKDKEETKEKHEMKKAVKDECKIEKSKECKEIIEDIKKESCYLKQDNHKRIQENSRIDGADFEQYEKDIEKIKNISSYNFSIKGKIGQYFEQIAEGFEDYNQELDGVKYCKWYKIPVNAMDDLCNISNYNKYTLAYYPMLNYYPYINKNKHFLLGYKCDATGDLKYIVYGIPGSKDNVEQPYEGKTGFVTWTHSEMRNEGYWLMFYDFKNSTIVVPMK
ncbi:hypothetical protein [Clostridium uliginosum]|uniref:DUF7922 domain-containing protein n=1 Tax=Clostridium uliginosum TaxID=119641 RepID=A0A1I1L4F6_9CLOT|nr:hypothetical protein [Clostridium uliginosum]SFC67871.1 hypothetical protein SAMN05421842_10770 [Clostridium uliginosum]